MKLIRLIPAVLISGLLLIGLSACEKEPAEKAGDAIEEAASDAAQATEEAAEAIKEKMDN